MTYETFEKTASHLGARILPWRKPVLRELHKSLLPDERVQKLLFGRYQNGFALLAATDKRLLIIDKKPMRLVVEDIRYDTITEIDFHGRGVEASVQIATFNRVAVFRSAWTPKLRDATSFIQHKIMRTAGQQTQSPVQAYTQRVHPVAFGRVALSMPFRTSLKTSYDTRLR